MIKFQNIRQGRVEAIRLSTRPDALSEKILLSLKAAGVETVELGVQSLNDQALERSGRGHSAQDSINAVQLLRKFSLGVGIQLMAGLPGDTPEGFNQTIRGELFLMKIKQDLVGRRFIREADLELRVAGRDMGFLTGNNRGNLKKLKTDLGIAQLQVAADPALPSGKWQLRSAGLREAGIHAA